MQIYATCDFCEYFYVHGYDWSFNPILLKIDIHASVMHVRFTMTHMSQIIDFLKINIGSCKFMSLATFCKQNCVHGFDWSTNLSFLKIDYMYVLQWRMSQIIDFFKISIVIANKFVCTVLTDLQTQFLLKMNIHVHVLWWCMSEVTDLKKYYWYCCKFMQLAIIVNIFVRTVFTDVVNQFCWNLIYMYTVMSARRGGARGGTCPPPPGNSKIWGPPKDNLTMRRNWTEGGPYIVSEETDLRGPLYSMWRNWPEGATYSKRRN